MITHYDMMTGEVIEDESRGQAEAGVVRPDETAAPRLLTVQEAAAIQKPGPRLPADVAVLPVDTLIARWS